MATKDTVTPVTKKQVCRKCLEFAVPAVTITITLGHRLQWCAKHVEDSYDYKRQVTVYAI